MSANFSKISAQYFKKLYVCHTFILAVFSNFGCARRLKKRDNGAVHGHENHKHEHQLTSEHQPVFAGGKLSEEDILLDELNAQIVTGVVSIIVGSVLLAVLIIVMVKIYDNFFCSASDNTSDNEKANLEDDDDEEIPVKPVLGILKLISEMPVVTCDSEGDDDYDKPTEEEEEETHYPESPQKLNKQQLQVTTSATQTAYGLETTDNSNSQSSEVEYYEEDTQSLGDLDDCKIISRHSLKEVPCVLISTSETFVTDSFEDEDDDDDENDTESVDYENTDSTKNQKNNNCTPADRRDSDTSKFSDSSKDNTSDMHSSIHSDVSHFSNSQHDLPGQ